MEAHTTLEFFSNGWKDESNYPNWTPITLRKPTPDELEDNPDWIYVAEDTPPEDEEVLVSNGKWVWLDTLCNNGDFLYWDNSDCELEETAWMSLPPLWKKD